MSPGNAMALTLRQPGTYNVPIKRSPASRYISAGMGKAGGKISKPGLDWLKAAFAAPDFPVLTPSGIPDQYTGRTLIHMDRYVQSITIPKDCNDFYIIVPPIPGVSHCEKSFTAGTGPGRSTTWQATYYSSFISLFGNDRTFNADNVTAFRYMSKLVELVPTTNNAKWTGSISVFKVPIKCDDAYYASASGFTPANTLAQNLTLMGMAGIESTNSDQYTAPSNLGCFSAAHQNNNDFPFNPIKEGNKDIPHLEPDGLVPGTQYGAIVSTMGLPGFGNLDTVVVRISGAADNSFILKTWATMEYQIQNKSALYQYTVQSPMYDPAAIAAYSAMVRASPNAVSYYENSGFWNFIKNTIKTISGTLSMVPGPVGMVSGGIHSILSGLFK